MNRLFVILLLAAGTMSCSQPAPQQTGATTLPPPILGFPIIPPISTADPSKRSSVSVRVPTGLDVVRKDDSLSIKFASFEPIDMTIGHDMLVGLESEYKIVHNGRELPSLGSSGLGGVNLESHLGSYEYAHTRRRDKIPIPGERYEIQYRITIFETDVPTQHFWSPRNGKHYRVLWSQTFTETSK